jgi:hypothetical protein
MLKIGDIVTRGSEKGTVDSVSPLKIRKYGVQPIAYYSNPVESEWSGNPPEPEVVKPLPFGTTKKTPNYGTFAGRRRKSRKNKRKTRRHRR